MFAEIYQTKSGDTVRSDNPKIDAYKQMYYLARLGYRCGLVIHDGMYTVSAETISQSRIANITFAPIKAE